MSDLQQINSALERLFHVEGQRIVFWNDPDREKILQTGKEPVLIDQAQVLFDLGRELQSFSSELDPTMKKLGIEIGLMPQKKTATSSSICPKARLAWRCASPVRKD